MGLDSRKALELVSKSLSAKKLRHTIGVKDLAEDLARHHGLDPEKAKLAALLHDLAKDSPGTAINPGPPLEFNTLSGG